MAKKEEPKPAAESTALAVMPAFIEQNRAGFENVVDMTFERLKLMQDKSPELKVSPDILSKGSLYRKSTNESYYNVGGPVLRVIICYYFKEWIEFGDRDNPAQEMILGRSLDPHSKLAEESRQWVKKATVKKGMVRKVQDIHNFVVVREGALTDPFLVSFSRTSNPYGQGLLNLCNQRGNVPIYAGRYEIFTQQETNKRAEDYFVIKARGLAKTDPAYWATQEEYQSAKLLNEMATAAQKAGRLKGTEVDPDDAPEASAPADMSGTDAKKAGDL